MTQSREIFQTTVKDFINSLNEMLSEADMKTMIFLSETTGTIDIEQMEKEKNIMKSRILEISKDFKPSYNNLLISDRLKSFIGYQSL